MQILSLYNKIYITLVLIINDFGEFKNFHSCLIHTAKLCPFAGSTTGQRGLLRLEQFKARCKQIFNVI